MLLKVWFFVVLLFLTPKILQAEDLIIHVDNADFNRSDINLTVASNQEDDVAELIAISFELLFNLETREERIKYGLIYLGVGLTSLALLPISSYAVIIVFPLTVIFIPAGIAALIWGLSTPRTKQKHSFRRSKHYKKRRK